MIDRGKLKLEDSIENIQERFREIYITLNRDMESADSSATGTVNNFPETWLNPEANNRVFFFRSQRLQRGRERSRDQTAFTLLPEYRYQGNEFAGHFRSFDSQWQEQG